MRKTATWIALGLIGLVAAGCERKPAAPASAEGPAPAATPVAPAPAAAAAPAVAAATPVPPETVLAVTQALAQAQAFNAKTAGDLAAVAKAQARIHELAGQAAADAAKAGPGQESERLALGRRVGQARTDAEAAHSDLAARQSVFRATAQTQVDATAQALLLCGATPEFAASEPCAKLLAEQVTLSKAVGDLTARFAAAETAYLKDRARLEEASATMALGVR